jgi:hypothetical protein
MQLRDFLTRVIDDGLVAARADYARPEQADKLRGAVDGFELCRGCTPFELRTLYLAVEQDAFRRLTDTDYWYWCCLAAEVEWVCNVMSVPLASLGIEPILAHLPTVRGVIKAAEVLEGLHV